jgi:ribosome maturation factor RimP
MAVTRISDRLKEITGISSELQFELVVASYGDDSHGDMVRVFLDNEQKLDKETSEALRELLTV